MFFFSGPGPVQAAKPKDPLTNSELDKANQITLEDREVKRLLEGKRFWVLQTKLAGLFLRPDGDFSNDAQAQVHPDGTVIYPDGTQLRANGTVIYPDGTKARADGTVIYPDGRQLGPDD